MMRVVEARELLLQRVMLRANKLSVQGLGLTAPNPIVGAVILDASGREIAAGFHSGEEHAEIIAINAARKDGFTDFSECTLVVTLEPCNHHGKTPPCTATIIAERFRSVVFAVADPNPIATGGAAELKSAGIDVLSGVEHDFVAFTNRAWLHKIAEKRPWFVAKIAATLDGKITAADGSSKWITSDAARRDVALIRNQSDAILTSTSTVLADNPELTPRFPDFNPRGATATSMGSASNPTGRRSNPVRIVMGTSTIPQDFQINNENAKTRYLSTHSVDELVKMTSESGWNQVMIEAGARFNSALIQAGVIDEILLYQAPTLLGAGKSFVTELGIKSLDERQDLSFGEIIRVGNDLRIQLFVKNKNFSSIFKSGTSTGGIG